MAARVMSVPLTFLTELDAIGREAVGPVQRRALVNFAFHRLAEFEKRGELHCGEWEQRCLLSAAAYFCLGNYDAALTQLRALGQDRRRHLMALMPRIPITRAGDVLRHLETSRFVPAKMVGLPAADN